MQVSVVCLLFSIKAKWVAESTEGFCRECTRYPVETTHTKALVEMGAHSDFRVLYKVITCILHEMDVDRLK